jgi:K+-sensing histidine kinase KdpD
MPAFALSERALRSILARHGPPVLSAMVLVAATTVVISAVRAAFHIGDESLVYLIPVLFSATRWGLVPALVAAVTGTLACTYFFYEPKFTLYVADPAEFVDLVMFIILAVVTSPLAAAQRKQAEAARQREADTRGLYAFSRRLASAQTAFDIYAAIQDHLSKLVSRRVVLLGTADASLDQLEWIGTMPLPDRVREQAISIAGKQTGWMTETTLDEDGQLWLVRALSARTPDLGVIAIELGPQSDALGAVKRRIEAILADAATTLEHLDFARAINDARMREETDRLRDALIGSVSHELRTPLASILGAATVLADAPTVVKEMRLRSLATVVREEAERLDGDIQKLLDATRVTGEVVQPKRQWIDPADIVNSALARRNGNLVAFRVTAAIAPDLPLINVDAALIEQAFGQVLDNAAKYSPAGSAIEVSARAENEQVILSVRDEGAGLTADEQARMWERFFRGQRHISTIAGFGLGLWIAHAFVTANGGRLAATSQGPGRGSTVSIALPAAQMTISDRAYAHAFSD